MAQLIKISIVLMALAIIACSAEAPRYRQRLVQRKLQPLKQRQIVQQKRVLARQEAVTPYPTAEELKPEVAFEEGNTPDEVYGPPDQTYGPPEVEQAPADQAPADQLPSEEAPEEFAPNPDAEEFQPSEVEPAIEEPAPASRLTNSRRKTAKKIVPSRLVQKKKVQKSSRLVLASTPVVAAAAPVAEVPVAVPFASPYTQQSQQYFVVNQPFAYTAQYQAW